MTEVSQAGSGTTTSEGNEEVRAAMVAHHVGLVAGLEERVAAAEGAVAPDGGAESELRAVVDYLEAEVISHAEAEEAALYRLARTGELVALIQAMVTEHEWLRAETTALAGAGGVAGAARARAILAVFALHADKENDLVLPALAARPEIDLGVVLAAMHEHLTKAAVAGDGTEEELDVRSLPHASRHERIFACLGDLKVDQSLVIANDHDPKPLYYQLEALWPGAYDWSYLDRGPQIWRVRVCRQEAAA